MRLTTALYYTPSGRSIQGKSIDPDIVVEPAKVETISSARRTREADLHGAIENPEDAKPDDKKEPAKKPDAGEKPVVGKDDTSKNEPPQDYQLARALDLLRGLSLYSETLTKRTN